MDTKPEAKLLIVDDNEGVRHLVSRWLERAGFRVEEASDGAEAVEMVRKNPPDVILADIRMPKIDGIELARIVKSEFPGIKIILMTAYSSPQTIAQAKREGVDDYLEKPFTKDQVEKMALDIISR
ncbi:response regulator [Candidatus Solincola tengchongensis]|uniref:response regulator n=1 Tax=Candidatus Solincola tengchongensis TaxID=2900693 RepID=UPI002579EC21|nr:response regulator [Candidatus Solincola tengchongensis]